MRFGSDEERDIRREFDRLTNTTRRKLAAWLETAESTTLGLVRKGETESAGRQSAKKILAIRDARACPTAGERKMSRVTPQPRAPIFSA